MEDIVEILNQYEKTNQYVETPYTYRKKKSKLFSQFYPVRTNPVKYNSECEDIFVVSDLHIAAGKNSAGIYGGTENFYADESFKRFLDYANEKKKTDHALLILNGDTFDFLRIVDHPVKKKKFRFSKWIKHPIELWHLKKHDKSSAKLIADQFDEWSEELKKVGISKNKNELELSITKKEKTYGLGTEDFKTIYKLILIKNGHPVFIEALRSWLGQGNKLMFVKGNHDLELYWPKVRDYIRQILTNDLLRREKANPQAEALEKTVMDNIIFIDDSVVVDEDFYVEHGHRYDKFCMVLGSPVTKKNNEQINIPFGSFFNRYIINRVEMHFPFLDNVRPASNILSVLIKTNFPLALRIMFQIVYAIRLLIFKNFRYVWFMINKVIWLALVVIAPLAIIILLNIDDVTIFLDNVFKILGIGGLIGILIDQIKNIALLILSYILARLVGWFQLEEPSCLDKFARERFKGADFKIITMGHTHNPGQYQFNKEQKFYNSGTWIPIIETSTAEVREDKTYTFLHLTRNKENRLISSRNGLERWNDNALRADPQVLIKRK